MFKEKHRLIRRTFFKMETQFFVKLKKEEVILKGNIERKREI